MKCYLITVIFVILYLSHLSQGQWNDLWRPPQMAKLYRGGEMTYIYSDGDDTFDAWYVVGERRQFVFQVRGCAEVNIALGTYRNTVEEFTIEVVLGSDGNTRSGIRFSLDVGYLHSVDTPDILNCHEYRTFWISWTLGIIQVGRGPIKGEQILTFTIDSIFHKINAVGLRSMFGNAAVFGVQENSGEYFQFLTPAYYRYQMMWKSVEKRSFQTFRVKACSDVHIALAENMGDTSSNIYEVVLGGFSNQRTLIRTNTWFQGDTGEWIKASADTPDLLNCDGLLEFWLSWKNGSVEVGQGTLYGKRRLAQWKDAKPHNVRYLSATTGWETTGLFRFEDDLESFTFIQTPDTGSLDVSQKYNSTWFESPHKMFFTFGVTACWNVYVFLSSFKGVDEDFGYEIYLGEQQNTKSGIRYVFEPDDLISVSDNSLNCDEVRYFWISWWNGTLIVGQHSIYGQGEIMRYYVGIYYPINAVGIATTQGKGLFRVRDTSGEKISINIPKFYNNHEVIWRWMPQYQQVVFACKACEDCHVSLAPTVGVDALNEWYIDVIIGGYSNQKSSIKVKRGKSNTELTIVDTPNLLKCNDFVDLWVSWIDGYIRMGTGAIPLTSQLMTANSDLVRNIKAVSFDSWKRSPIQVNIWENNGDAFTLYTTDKYDYFQHWLTVYPNITWVTFYVRACNDAHLMLSSIWADPNPEEGSDLIEIVLGGWDNTRTVIRTAKQGDAVNETQHEYLLDCSNNRPFWVSWTGGNVQVGKGNIYGMDTMVTWQHPKPFTVISMSISTGWYSYGRWQILGNYGPRLMTNTPDNHYHQYNWRMVEHRQSFHFNIQACSDAHIALSERQSILDAYAYEVVIGGWNNTQSIIREMKYQTWLAQTSTPKILDCNKFLPFWITWYGGSISVGRGEYIGKEIFLDFQETSPKFIKAISIATGYGNTGNWTFELLREIIEPEPPFVVPRPTRPTQSGLSAGAIAGIVIGVLAAIVALSAIVFVLHRQGVFSEMKEKVQGRLGSTQFTDTEQIVPPSNEADISDAQAAMDA